MKTEINIPCVIIPSSGYNSAFTNHNRVIEDTPGTIIKFLKHKEGTTALVIVEGSIKEVYLESIKLPKEF